MKKHNATLKPSTLIESIKGFI